MLVMIHPDDDPKKTEMIGIAFLRLGFDRPA